MDPIRKIPKKFTKKSGNKVINRQYFCRKTGLKPAELGPTQVASEQNHNNTNKRF